MTDRVVRVTVAAQVAQYVQAMEQVKKASEKAKAGSVDAAAAIEKQNQAMQSMGVRLMAAGAVATAATAIAVKAAIDWESAWAGVTKTVDGTPEQLARVEQGLRDLTGVLPASHEEIAAVAEAAGQLGIQTDNVVAFTKTMVDLGETTNLSANDAATAIARFTNIMGTSQDQVSNLGSALVGLGNNYATTEREILEMSMRLAGAGRQVGLSEGEVLGLATALSSVGIEAEAGGSAMSKVMINIASAVETGGAKLDAFASAAGMTAKQFAAQWRTEPAQAMSAFVKGLANAEAQGSSTLGVLAELGVTEVRMRDALLRASSAADLFAGAMSRGNREFSENVALADEAAKRYATVESQLGIMSNKVNDAAIDFGDVFLPAVSAVATVVGGLADLFGDLPVGVQTVVAGGVALAGAAALAGGAFLIAVPKIAQFNLALATLSASQLPAVAAAATGATATIGKMTAGMGAAARFLTGPWGFALAAAAVGVVALQKVVDNLATSAEDFQNIIKTGPTAERLLEAGDRSLISTLHNATASVSDFKRSLDLLGEGKDFLRGFDLAAQQLKASLGEIGKQLATTAATDLPAAQGAFRELVDTYELTDAEQRLVLDTMDEYRAALTLVASDHGVMVTSGDEAADKTALLALALGTILGAADSAATGIEGVGDEASIAASNLDTMAAALDDVGRAAWDMGAASDDAQAALNKLTEQWEASVEAQREAGDTAGKTTAQIDADREAADRLRITLDGTNDASIRFRDAMRDVEQTHRDSAEAILDNGGSLQDATTEWEKGREAVIQMRESMGESRAEAEKWADENVGRSAEVRDALKEIRDAVIAIPDRKTIAVEANTVPAANAIDQLVKAYNGTTLRLNVATDSFYIPSRARGGRIPGVPSREDNVLAAVATGEYVVNSDATRRHLALLEHINAGGHVAGYANGGFVENTRIHYATPSPAPSPLTGSADRIADRIVEAIRSNPGVNVSFHNPVQRDVIRDAYEAAQILNATW